MSKAEISTDNQTRIDKWFTDFQKEVDVYLEQSLRTDNNLESSTGLAKLQGKDSNLYIGALNVTADTAPKEIIEALFTLPSPFVQNDEIVDGNVFYMPSGADKERVDYARTLFDAAEELSEQGQIVEAADIYMNAADVYINNELYQHAGNCYASLSFHLSKHIEKLANSEDTKSQVWNFESLMVYATDAKHKLEHMHTNKFAIPIEQGMGGYVHDERRLKVGTGNLQDCHFLAIKSEPANISYTTHNDVASSSESDKGFKRLPTGNKKVIIAGANSLDSEHSVLNVLDSIYAMASTGENIAIEQSHLLRRGNIKVQSCTYHPAAFTLTLSAPALVHPDYNIEAGWWHSCGSGNRYPQVAFDTRYQDKRVNDHKKAFDGELSPIASPEQRFAIGLTSSNVERLHYSTPDMQAFYNNASNDKSFTHTGHWYNEYDALKRTLKQGRTEILQHLFEDQSFLKQLQTVFKVDDLALAKIEILNTIKELPCYIGTESEKPNQYLALCLKETFLRDRDFGVYTAEVLDDLKYQIVEGQVDQILDQQVETGDNTTLAERLAESQKPIMVDPKYFYAKHFSRLALGEFLDEDIKTLLELCDAASEDFNEKYLEGGYFNKTLSVPNGSAQLETVYEINPKIQFPVIIGSNTTPYESALLGSIKDIVSQDESLDRFESITPELFEKMHQNVFENTVVAVNNAQFRRTI